MTTLKKKIALLSTVIAAASLLAIFAPMGIAVASHSAEPTMWVNGINAGQTHSYIYMVPGPTNGMDMAVALMIKDMGEKPNVQLTVTNPLGGTVTCPIAGPTAAGVPTLLLVSECFFSPPTPGLYTISISGGVITNNPVGYAIAADTVVVDHVVDQTQ